MNECQYTKCEESFVSTCPFRWVGLLIMACSALAETGVAAAQGLKGGPTVEEVSSIMRQQQAKVKSLYVDYDLKAYALDELPVLKKYLG